MVDLERREVVDVLPGRSSEETANWLRQHPNVEVVSRDRCGLYAQGIRQGAPEARQVADRFHLLQNLRERIEHQLSRSDKGLACPSLPRAEGEDVGLIACSTPGRQVIAEDRYLKRLAHQRSRQAMFEKVQILKAEGRKIRGIALEMGVNWRTVRKWVHANEMPERRERPRRQNRRAIFGIILQTVGRKDAGAADNSSRKFSCVAIGAAVPIWSAS